MVTGSLKKIGASENGKLNFGVQYSMKRHQQLCFDVMNVLTQMNALLNIN